MSEESSIFKTISGKNQWHVLKPWEYNLSRNYKQRETQEKNGNMQNSLSEPKCKKPWISEI